MRSESRRYRYDIDGARDGRLMFRKVLLCYDGSAEGRRALRQGADIALYYAKDRLWPVSDLPKSALEIVDIE